MTDPMKVFASCVRGALIAAPGKDLISLDFAGIESRVTAWLAGEEWKLQAFRDYDAKTGPDTYKLAYARAFQIPVEKVNDNQRQIGKVMELALGYQGGVGAFTTMTKTYGVKLDELTEVAWDVIPEDVKEEAERFLYMSGRSLNLPKRTFIVCDSIKRLWRRAHPKVVALWQSMEKAAVYATSNPGKVFSIPNKKIMFCVKSPRDPRHSWLYMRLPSGRRIAYFQPEIHREQVKDENGDLVDGNNEHLTYMGVDTKTRRWMRVTTYGGRIVQNAGEGVPRDLLVAGLHRMEAAGYDTIMTIHDQGVFERNEGEGSFEEAYALMCAKDDWADGLPVAADGWVGHRFRK